MYIPHWVAMPAGIWGAYHLPSFRAAIITLILYLELPFIGFPTAWNARSAFLHLLLAGCIFLPCYLRHHRTAMVLGLVITRLLITHTYLTATLLAIAISIKIFFVPLLTLFFPNLHLRAATVSLRGGRAIEWRKDRSSSEPDVFVERIGIEVDRRDPKLRRLAIVVKGLVVRVRPSKEKPRRESATEERDAEPQVPEKVGGSWTSADIRSKANGSKHWLLRDSTSVSNIGVYRAYSRSTSTMSESSWKTTNQLRFQSPRFNHHSKSPFNPRRAITISVMMNEITLWRHLATRMANLCLFLPITALHG